MMRPRSLKRLSLSPKLAAERLQAQEPRLRATALYYTERETERRGGREGGRQSL